MRSTNRSLSWFLVMVFLVVIVSQAASVHAGVVFWCDQNKSHLHGYTGVYSNQYASRDNVAAFEVDYPYILTSVGFYNGGPVNAIDLISSQSQMQTYYTNSGPLPYLSAVQAMFSDGTCLVTPNEGGWTPIVASQNESTCIDVAIGGGGANPLSYSSGYVVSNEGSLRYQAAQLAPPGGHVFERYVLPATLQQDSASALIYIQNHLGYVAGAVPQAARNQYMSMKNSSIAHIYLNGQVNLALPVYSNLQVTISVDSDAPCLPSPYGDPNDQYNVDYWVVALLPNGSIHWYNDLVKAWLVTPNAQIAGQTTFVSFPPYVVLDRLIDRTGNFKFYFCVDFHPDAFLNSPLICADATLNVY